VAEGRAEDLHGAPVLAAARLESPLAGGAAGGSPPVAGKAGPAARADR